MFLSRLILNPWSRQVMSEMGNSYEMHRTIMRAFPSAEESGPGRVLFRVDLDKRDNTPVLLVQSEKEPDWSFLHDKDYLASTEKENPARKSYCPAFYRGQVLSFLIRANPTKRLGSSSASPGKRVGIEDEAGQLQWFERKASQAGFVAEAVRVIPKARSESHRAAVATTHACAEFAGVMRVTDPDKLVEAIKNGIGSAKGFGFGLLSVAPVRG